MRGDAPGAVDALVEARALAVSYGTTQALRSCDLALHTGDRVALMGPSGSGKSTLLHCLTGMVPLVSAATLQSVYGVDSFASYEITADPGTAAQVERELTTMTETAGFPVRVIPSAEFLDDALVTVEQIQALMVLILVVIALCAGIAAFNTFAAAVLVRTRELRGEVIEALAFE